MKTIIAIDPGAAGGIAIQHNCLITLFAMPDTDGDLIELIQTLRPNEGSQTEAVIERVGGYTGGEGQPGSGMFNFGDGAGFIRGALMALDIPIVMVHPQKWQKYYSLGTSRGDATPEQWANKKTKSRLKRAWKNKLKSEAQRRFPNLKITLKTADALLILEWYRATRGGGQ